MSTTVAYSFIEIPIFDARSGLRSCSPPGVGVSAQGCPKSNADFWRSPTGSIMLRVTRRKVRHAFEARLATGNPIQERYFEKFTWFVSDQMFRWSADLDDEPFDGISFPYVVTPPSNNYWLARLLVCWMDFNMANRDPEIVRELLPDFGNIKVTNAIADATDLNTRFCLLIEHIVEEKTKAKRLQKSATSEIDRKAAATVERRLSAVESHLMKFLADTLPRAPQFTVEPLNTLT